MIISMIIIIIILETGVVGIPQSISLSASHRQDTAGLGKALLKTEKSQHIWHQRTIRHGSAGVCPGLPLPAALGHV